MEETFTNCKRQCRRWTPEGCSVEVETRTEPAQYRGKSITAVITTWKGAHMLDDGFNVWRVVRSETWDGGAMGLTLAYSVQRERTEEETREYLQNLKAVVEQVFPGYTLSNAYLESIQKKSVLSDACNI